MHILASLLLIVALATATVSRAKAYVAPDCASQLRVADMCYPAAMPGKLTETPKTAGACVEILLTQTQPLRRDTADRPVTAAIVPMATRQALMAVPWRPPRA